MDYWFKFDVERFERELKQNERKNREKRSWSLKADSESQEARLVYKICEEGL